MSTSLLTLDDARIPGYPDASLMLDRSSLSIAPEQDPIDHENSNSELTAAVCIATVLYRWCPEALYAFLDLDAWFSFTWIVTIQQGQPDEHKIEIGRVRNQVTVGTLDKDGADWTLMITYNISVSGADRGAWIPNPDESSINNEDIDDPAEIDKLGRAFGLDLLLQKRWLTGPKVNHQLFVEYAPMDIWGDGIPMNPHLLYHALDLGQCSTCSKGPSKAQGEGEEMSSPMSLRRCGRCGTAAYCSDICQRLDWPVHKAICKMTMEERGQVLHLTQVGGLVNWHLDRAGEEESEDDEDESDGDDDSYEASHGEDSANRDDENDANGDDEKHANGHDQGNANGDEKGMSKNPHFATPQPKRHVHHYQTTVT